MPGLAPRATACVGMSSAGAAQAGPTLVRSQFQISSASAVQSTGVTWTQIAMFCSLNPPVAVVQCLTKCTKSAVNFIYDGMCSFDIKPVI